MDDDSVDGLPMIPMMNRSLSMMDQLLIPSPMMASDG
jgi:hypothetical protein